LQFHFTTIALATMFGDRAWPSNEDGSKISNAVRMIGFKTLLARCGRGIPGSGGGETVSSSPLMRPGSGAAMVGDADRRRGDCIGFRNPLFARSRSM
jgi:hypothetical protein